MVLCALAFNLPKVFEVRLVETADDRAQAEPALRPLVPVRAQAGGHRAPPPRRPLLLQPEDRARALEGAEAEGAGRWGDKAMAVGGKSLVGKELLGKTL